MGRRRPIVATYSRTVCGSTFAPTGSGKEDAVAVLLGNKKYTGHAVQSAPFPSAMVEQFFTLGLGGQAPATTPIGASGIVGGVAADVV